MKRMLFLSAGLGLALLACREEKETPRPATVADFTTTGTLQNFTPLQFSGSSDGATAYAWNFGDNTTAQEQNPAHTFRRAGTYTVSLTATGPNGAATVSKQLTLAQADTLALINQQVIGVYDFYNVYFSAPSFSGPPTFLQLRDTSMAITQVGNDLKLMNRQLRMYPFGTSSFPWPGASSTRRIPTYVYVAGSPDFGLLIIKQQSDSINFSYKESGVSNLRGTYFYRGKKRP